MIEHFLISQMDFDSFQGEDNVMDEIWLEAPRPSQTAK